MFPLHEPLDAHAREELKAYDDLVAALLFRRGVTTRDGAARFLEPSYDEHVHDPLTMTDMRRAAERLARAIREHERIAVWTDYDCDGVPAAVLLHDFLTRGGADFEVHIPHRHHDGYGVNVPGVEALAARGARVIVTADSGITDTAAAARAKELGVNLIITDHHLPGVALPDAYAVVNPNARADEPYPFKGLCGAAVAWKLVVATLLIDTGLAARIGTGWEKWLLDMVAIATVADMMPLVDENRVLVKYGLIVLRKSPRPGVAALCDTMRATQRELSEDDIGFSIAPRVNAASRMGDARDAFLLLSTTDRSEAVRLAKKLEAANRARKAQAGAITRAAHSHLKTRPLRDVIVLGDPDWRPSLLGLVANGLADEFERPVFLWGREGNGAIKGSVRSGSVHALELMTAATGAFTQFGGHAASGGFTVRDDAIFDLEERLVAALKTLPANDTDAFEQRADAAVTLQELSPRFFARLGQLAPFGEKNPRPVFLVREACVRAVSRFGKHEEHLKLGLVSTDGTRMDAITFFAKGALARTAESLPQNAPVHVLGFLERDTFSRGNPLRLRLLNLKLES